MIEADKAILDDYRRRVLDDLESRPPGSVPFLVVKLRLFCPHCGARHVEQDGGDPKMRWERRGHTTHRCRECSGDFDVFVGGASDGELGERQVDDG